MENLTKPQLISGPFAYNGQKNSIPDAPTGNAHASIQEGFPPITFLPEENGGEAPFGQDFNGLGNLLSQFYFYTQNGGLYTFEPEVSEKIGGYPLNALLWYFPQNGTSKWLRSTKPNNMDNFNLNPDFIGTSWVEENTGFSIGNIGDIKETTRTDDAPAGGVWADGTEYTFAEFPKVGEMLQEGKLRQKSYTDWQNELTTYGETEYFAYDSGTQKFKVPNMPWNGLDGEVFDETTLKVYKRPSRKYVILYSDVQEISIRDYTEQLEAETQKDITSIQQEGAEQIEKIRNEGVANKANLVGNNTFTGINTFTKDPVPIVLSRRSDQSFSDLEMHQGGVRRGALRNIAETNGFYTTGLMARRTDATSATLSVSIKDTGEYSTYAPPSSKKDSILTTISTNKSANGYYWLGNQMCIQYGYVTGFKNMVEAVIPLNIPFLSTDYSLVMVQYGGIEGDFTNGFTIRGHTVSNFTVMPRTGGDSGAWWMAIGRV